MHWGARQSKLETPKDKDEVNKQDIHECDGCAHDPDTMVVLLTPKPKRKAEALTRASPTIVWSREEDTVMRKWPKPRYRCASCNLETKTKVVYYESLNERYRQKLYMDIGAMKG